MQLLCCKLISAAASKISKKRKASSPRVSRAGNPSLTHVISETDKRHSPINHLVKDFISFFKSATKITSKHLSLKTRIAGAINSAIDDSGVFISSNGEAKILLHCCSSWSNSAS